MTATTTTLHLPSDVRVGAAVRLETQTQAGPATHRSRIEEVEGGQLHVAAPTERGQLVPIPTGHEVQVVLRAASGAELFINGEVAGHRGAPFPVVLIRPLSLTEHQQRSFFRLRVQIHPEEAWVHDPPGAQGAAAGPAPDAEEETPRPVDGLIVDLSGGGLGFVTNADVANGATLHVRFRLEGEDELLALQGRVVAARTVPDTRGRLHLGVHFEELDGDGREELVRTLTRLQLEARRRSRE